MLKLEVKLELALLAATIYNRGRDMKMVVGQIPIRFLVNDISPSIS